MQGDSSSTGRKDNYVLQMRVGHIPNLYASCTVLHRMDPSLFMCPVQVQQVDYDVELAGINTGLSDTGSSRGGNQACPSA